MITTIIIYLILCFLVGNAGHHRNIGWTNAFWLSVFLSPLVGVIGVALSQRKQPTQKPLTDIEKKAKVYDEKYGNN